MSEKTDKFDLMRKRVARTKTSLSLNAGYYARFKALCQEHKVSQSELIDLLIKDFLDEYDSSKT